MATKKQGLSNYRIRKIKDNLRHFYNQADQDQIERGKAWYLQANIWCETMAVKYGYPSEVVAEVLSALSPRNKWERNKKDAEAVLSAVRNNKTMSSVKVCTFNNNKEKAFDIARLKTRIVHGAPKTYAFVQNIAHLNEDYITIDVWHKRACFDVIDTSKVLPNLTELKYKQIEKATKQVAKEFDVRGYEFQAIVWNVVREA